MRLRFHREVLIKNNRCGRDQRTQADCSRQPVSGGKSGSTKNRLKRWQGQADGLCHRLLQDQLLAQCEETLPTKVVRLLQGADRLVRARRTVQTFAVQFVTVRTRRRISVSRNATCGTRGRNSATGLWRDRSSVSVCAVALLGKRHVDQISSAVACTVGLRKTGRDKCEHEADTDQYFFELAPVFPCRNNATHTFSHFRLLRNFLNREIAPFPPPKRARPHLSGTTSAGPIQELT